MARLLFKTDHQSNIDHETTMRYTRIYKYNTIDLIDKYALFLQNNRQIPRPSMTPLNPKWEKSM